MGFSALLSDPDVTTEERENFNLIINRSSDTLLSLINDVIDFSKIEAGRLDIQMDEVPITSIVKQVKDIFDFETKQQRAEGKDSISFNMIVPEMFSSVTLFTDELRSCR